MKIISAKKITETIRNLCLKANLDLRNDVLAALKLARLREKNKRARNILDAIVKNAFIAREERLAICQDTGIPCVFVELGQDVKINGDLNKAINKGIVQGYKNGFFRESIVKEPISRKESGYTPTVIHIDIVGGDKLKLTVLPKGFGCENKSQLKMFNPTAKIEEIKEFIIEAVKAAGPDACPPYVVGVGIGGTADLAMLLAKKSLLRRLQTPNSKLQTLEKELLNKINHLNIGPMGLGGNTTALAVNIEIYPTHIAGLPVAVNISCHALRSATKTL